MRDESRLMEEFRNPLGTMQEAWGGESECYVCDKVIPAEAANWDFTWGSDGVFPDGASAMICCWNCRHFWIYPYPSEASS